MRIALGVEYDGSQFHGWQAQKGLRTVQSELEKALSKVADHPVEIHCAGRTDTGVHATGQVVHFDTNSQRGIRAWIYGGNSNLPKDIAVRWAKQVDDDFHARHSAFSRHYRYIIYNHPIRSSQYTSGVTWQYRPLDVELMQRAAQYFIGEHDFTSFRAVSCQSRTPMRNVTEFNVSRHGDLVILEVKANAFLHHMVRNLAGVLITIGAGKRDSSWAKTVLDAKDRQLGAETAPPYGLYLVGVGYPEQYRLPQNEPGPLLLAGMR